MPERLTSQTSSRTPETASGRIESAGAGAPDDGKRCLDAMAGGTGGELAARVDAALEAYCQNAKTKPTRKEVVSAYRKFYVALGKPANGANVLEAFVEADANGVAPADIVTLLKSLPSPLAARFSPYDAALCLSKKPTPEPCDLAAAWSLGWDENDGVPVADGDLAKMLVELAGLPGFRSLLACRDLTVNLGGRPVRPADSPNLLRGLLVFAQSQGPVPDDHAGWARVARGYAKSVREFLRGDRTPQAVFLLGPSNRQDDANGSFKNGLPAWEETLRGACPDGKIVRAADKADLLRRASEFARKNPGAPFFISVVLHGIPEGGARHSGGDLSPQDFQALADVSPDATLHMHSCYAGKSLPETGKAAVLLDSGGTQGYTAVLSKLRDAAKDPANDFDGDGKVSLREARLAVFLRWRKSFLPTSFTPAGKKPVRLAAQERPTDAPQA